MSFVYIELTYNGKTSYQVGHYALGIGGCTWKMESAHDTTESAASRCHWLNGGDCASNEQMTVARIAGEIVARSPLSMMPVAAVKMARDIVETVYNTEPE